MIKNEFIQNIKNELQDLKEQGLYKGEYEILTSQFSEIEVKQGNGKKSMLNFCANNYLGLANNKNLIEIAKKSLDDYGLGTASVRFICGTLDIHKEFEKKLADFLCYEDVITFSSCFAANNGIFAALFDEFDAIISANLNHASLIDGIRLCKAQRYFYQFDDMSDLEKKLIEAKNNNHKNSVIVTDGVFSMDGDIAKLEEICDLAQKYQVMLLVDDCHATGFVGKNGRGTAELLKVEGKIDILTTTLGKAFGGTGGGVVASRKEIIDKLRNKSRPYLFSNNILPLTAAIGIEIINMINSSKSLIEKLDENTQYFRQEMTKAGFDIRKSTHPVVAVMFYDEILASQFAKLMIEEEDIYVIAFSFPVVPKKEARIRVQISAAHTRKHLERTVASFKKVANKLNIIK